MSTQSTINELTEDPNHVLPLEVFSADDTTETTVDSTMNVSECAAYVSSPAEATCVAVIIGRNAPTRKSILISPSRTSSSSAPFPRSHPPSRASSTTSTTLPTPADGIETVTPATTRPSSFDSSNEDSVCEQSPQGEELSQEQRLNVKFAPLPDMGPRKRRGMPLGIAARSRMVRRRRAQAGEPGAQPRVVATPMWTDEEMDVQRQRLAKAWEKEREKRDYYSDLDENGEPIEDPITTLGKLVKVAGKQLWNKIGGREGKDEKGKAKAREKEDDALSGKQRDSGEARYSTSSVSSSQIDHTSFPTEERTPVPHGIDKERDESWEEIRRKEIPRTQDDSTITRKISLWRRTRTASRIEGDSSSLSITKSPPSPTSKNFSIHSFSGWKSDTSKGDEVQPENRGGSSSLRRSLSF